MIENINTIDEHRSKIIRNRVFDCCLSSDWRQMAIENTVSSDLHTSKVQSLFDCHLSVVIKKHILW